MLIIIFLVSHFIFFISVW